MAVLDLIPKGRWAWKPDAWGRLAPVEAFARVEHACALLERALGTTIPGGG